MCAPHPQSLLLLLQWSSSSIFRGYELATTVGVCENITFCVFEISLSWTPATHLAHRDARWPGSQGQSHQGNTPVITSPVCCHWDLSYPSPHIAASGTCLWGGCSSIRGSFSCHSLSLYYLSGATREWATHLSLPLDLLLRPPTLSHWDLFAFEFSLLIETEPLTVFSFSILQKFPNAEVQKTSDYLLEMKKKGN